MALKDSVRKGLLVMAACLCLGMPATAQSTTTVTVDGGWKVFNFYTLYNQPTAWPQGFSFTLPTSGILTVTDLNLPGDRFEVFSNGVSLGLTSVPVQGPSGYNQMDYYYFYGSLGYDYSDIYDTVHDSRWSSGSWNLSAGDYLITGLALSSPYSSGWAALRVDTAPMPSPVLVPAAVWLLGSALAGCLGLRRFSQRRAA